jgi:predicted transposase YbfD/YdcC
MAKRKHTKLESLVTIISSISDPRIDRSKQHNLCDVLIIGLCSMLCGQGEFTAMRRMGVICKGWFEKFLELPNGIPSHDTFGRVFAAIKPDEFLTAFMRWTAAARRACGPGVVSIDGKALRRAKDAGEQAPVIVGAWGAQAGISLGQIKVDEKSNEITAVPELLEILALKGCIVTIDAMGCQKEIAKKIRSKGADYILALKGNQGKLHECVTCYLDAMIDLGAGGEHYYESVGRGHGRIEVRRCWACGDLAEWLPEYLGSFGEWDGLKSVAAVECERTVNGETTVFRRHFITSLEPDAEQIAKAVRAHWGIENSLHWVLDMVWREDEARARARYTAENLSSLRRLALNLIKAEDPDSKESVKSRMFRANLDPDYRLKLLGVELEN